VSIANSDRSGILVVNKDRGWTSHDVVAKVRRVAGLKRVGHAGTLDPMAEGVLPVLLGRATRLAELLQAGRKTYLATVSLGAATETDDAEGRVTEQMDVPPLSADAVSQVLQRFLGEQMQLPPRYSALKVNGERAYAVARRGDDVALAARSICVYDLQLRAFSPTQLELEVACSKGTYVRALARDIAAALGTVGHLSGLQRTQVGPFTLGDAHRMEELTADGLDQALLSPSRAVPDAPCIRVDDEQATRLRNGQPLPGIDLRSDIVWVYDRADRMICLAQADGMQVRPRLAL
jgi:tRNA pseudouridine55 synthase